MKKQTISLLLSLLLLLNLLPLTALAEDRVSGGPCGDSAAWSLDLDAGVLSFEGTGRLYDGMKLTDYNPSDYFYSLWWPKSDAIREIRFADGLTAVGADLLSAQIFSTSSDIQRIRKVRSILLPESIAEIGRDAFYSLTGLEEITVLNPKCVIEKGGWTLGNPEKTVVVGLADSTARLYAEANGYKFRAVNCDDGVHVYKDTVITPPSCDREGVAESECLICHSKTRKVIPAAHSYVLTEHLARTVYTCSVCGSSYAAGVCQRLKPEKYENFSVASDACVSVSFTPETTDIYRFDLMLFDTQDEASEIFDFASIYNSAGEIIAQENTTALLEAGKTYYCSYPYTLGVPLNVWAAVKAEHFFTMTGRSATCTVGGTVTYTCGYCGRTETYRVSKLSHDYSMEVLLEPTCTEDGLARYTCLRCGDTYTAPLEKSHRYEYVDFLPWYCYEVCEVCGDVNTWGTPDPPSLELGRAVPASLAAYNPGYFSNGRFFRFIPEKTEGYAVHTDAEGVYLEWMSQTGEIMTRSRADEVEPRDGEFAVLEAGQPYYVYIMTERTDLSEVSVTLTLEHNYQAARTVAPTCTAEGVLTYTCSCCGERYTEAIPPEHNWIFDVDLPWYRHGVCQVCGETGEFGTKDPPEIALDEEFTPVPDENGIAFFRFTPEQSDEYTLRHADDEGWTGVTGYTPDGEQLLWFPGMFREALEAGQTVFIGIADRDGDGVLPQLYMEQSHRYELATFREPTCTQEGESVGVCIYCGDSITEVIPPEHEVDYDVSLSWYRHGVCRRCGEEIEWGSRTPPEIKTGQTVTAEITEPEKAVFYRFTPEENGRYRFSVPDADGVFLVFTADDNYIEGRHRRETDSASFEAVCFAGKTYYICFFLYSYDSYGQARGERTGVVPLTVQLAEAVGISEIRPGQRLSASAEFPYDDAYIRFTAREDSFYEFSSDAPKGTRLTGILLDENGDMLDLSDTSDENFRFLFWLDAGQSVILQACNRYARDSTVQFDVLLRQVDRAFDPIPLRLDKAVPIQTDPQGEDTFLSFTPETSGYYEFFSSSGINVYCFLIDARMNVLDSGEDGPKGEDFQLRMYFEAGQTYYFRVNGYPNGGDGLVPVMIRRSANWSEPSYDWNGMDVMTAECRDEDHPSIMLTETACAARVVTKEAAYNVPGEEVYVFAFQNEMFRTQVRIVPIPPLDVSALPCDGTLCPGKQFTDMPAKDHWAHDAIDWALVSGVTTGATAETFSPASGCTRAQVVTFLWRAAGCPRPSGSENPFADVPAGAYYNDAVLWALEKGITTGTSAGKFSPDAVCTRAQIVTFLWRFEGSPQPETAVRFGDVDPDAYFAQAVAWAQAHGVTTGTAGGTFSPDSACTRAQVVTFLYRDLA